VREAVADYHSRIGRLSERERQRMLRVFDSLVPLIPARSQGRDPAGAEIWRAPAGAAEHQVIVRDTCVLLEGLTV